MVFSGEVGLFVHPITLEKLHDRRIDDWEAIRRAAMRTFDERWNKAQAASFSDSFVDRARIWASRRLAD